MKNIEFMSGANRQAIYKGTCDCGNVLTFTPTIRVTCVQCGKVWYTSIVAAAGTGDRNIDVSKLIGPSETKKVKK